ncbi:MAG: hypothetical protein ACRCS9_16305 [Hyphomicrobium sp.]
MPEFDGALPDVEDEHFAALVLDYFAEHNVITAEGAGARAALELLAAPHDIKGKTIVLYADTADAAWGYARKLKCCSYHELRVLPSKLALLIALKEFLDGTTRPPRIYAAGSRRFVQLIGELSAGAGVDAAKVSVERVDPVSLRITCGACRTWGDYQASSRICCTSCGTEIAPTRFYCDETHSFWGTVASEKTTRR